MSIRKFHSKRSLYIGFDLYRLVHPSSAVQLQLFTAIHQCNHCRLARIFITLGSTSLLGIVGTPPVVVVTGYLPWPLPEQWVYHPDRVLQRWRLMGRRSPIRRGAGSRADQGRLSTTTSRSWAGSTVRPVVPVLQLAIAA